ncbi:hypothetical protein IWW36_003803 [Coemansia brasiliensis]|uniref:Myb-like domain-containing protein n=1 Tax=Coemansia brasiliensis TaxID=2650707 RepID=A0A9W8IDC6_9FUNG|nr:hypothetical protein IWW36_003803 [Coemansia brasiliensis]
MLYRRFTTSCRQKIKLSFLEPNINPFGQWKDPPTTPIYPPAKHPRPTPQTPQSLWTLDERRALLLYSRAIQVHRNRDPDWHFVGSRLDRSGNECKFISQYMIHSWQQHHGWSSMQMKSIDGGVSADQLLGDIDKLNYNQHTRMWLKRLADPPEPALVPVKPQKRRMWTDEEDQQLLDECPLGLGDIAKGMKEFSQHSRRTIVAIRQRIQLLQKRHVQDKSPLSEDEQKIIAEAAENVYPEQLRWKHVRGKLSGRSLFDVQAQLLK